MPYREGETPAQTAKIDRCIKRVMATGKDRSSATAICIAQVHDKADEEVGKKMLNKQYTAEFKALKPSEEPGAKAGDFEAIVAVYDNVDRQGDRIKAGAFDESLEAWRKSGDPIPIVLAHGWDDPFKHIGYASPDNVKSIPGKGLYAKGHLDIDDNPLAKQVHRLMERRTLKEFSFGYRIPDGGERKASDGAYDLLAIDLIEFGPCLKGVNEETELLAIKSELEHDRARERGDEPTIEERFKSLEADVASILAQLREDKPVVVGEQGPELVVPTIDEDKADEDVEVKEAEDVKPIFDAEKAEHDRAEAEAYEEKAQREADEADRDRIKSDDILLEQYKQGIANFEASAVGRELLATDPDIDDARRSLDEFEV